MNILILSGATAAALIATQTGQAAPEAQATERWAIPQQITDGRWVFPSPDNVGVEAEPGWWPTENNGDA